MATLTISHYIYLTKEQRYEIHNKKSIKVIGIIIPVWFNKGNTSEPAQEIFCEYTLTNNDKNKPIVTTEKGFVINLPQKVELSEDTNISDEIKNAVVKKLGTSEMLLDINDGGAEWLEFRQYNKIKQGEKTFNLVHFVEIKSYELLKETLS